MRIDHGANSIEPHVRSQQTQAASTSKQASAGSTRGGSLTSVNVGSVEGLLMQIVSSSEIRDSVINDIKTKIQSGEYLAKQSALETASSILNL